MIPVGVVGCGRMGRLHARVCSQIPRVRLVGVHDANPQAAQATAQEYGSRAFDSIDELASQVRAVTIAVPTQAHLETARPFLDRGVACLIEKPLAPDVAQARQIVELARKHNAVVQVGHVERFNPAVRAMQRLSIHPGFIEVIRVSPMTFRSIDVGVVLDMMIHDIDIVLSLARSTVKRVDAAGVSVLGGPEDICNARLTFENGCVANLTASRLALKTERRLRIFSSEAYVSLDYQKKQGVFIGRKGNLANIRNVVARVKCGEITDLSQLNFQELVHIDQLEIDDVEPLRAEQDSFLDAVEGITTPAVSGEDGLNAVALAERIVAAIPPAELSDT
jgi:predicted dehydrogenase